MTSTRHITTLILGLVVAAGLSLPAAAIPADPDVNPREERAVERLERQTGGDNAYRQDFTRERQIDKIRDREELELGLERTQSPDVGDRDRLQSPDYTRTKG